MPCCVVTGSSGGMSIKRSFPVWMYFLRGAEDSIRGMLSLVPMKRKVHSSGTTAIMWRRRAGRCGRGRVSMRRATRVWSRATRLGSIWILGISTTLVDFGIGAAVSVDAGRSPSFAK